MVRAKKQSLPQNRRYSERIAKQSETLAEKKKAPPKKAAKPKKAKAAENGNNRAEEPSTEATDAK